MRYAVRLDANGNITGVITTSNDAEIFRQALTRGLRIVPAHLHVFRRGNAFVIEPIDPDAAMLIPEFDHDTIALAVQERVRIVRQTP